MATVAALTEAIHGSLPGADPIRIEDLIGFLDEDRGDVMVLFDFRGLFLYVSPSVEAMTGWPPSALVGRSASQFIHPDGLPALLASRREAISSSAAVIVGYRFRCADGTYLWVEGLARQVSHPNQPGGALLFSGIRNVSDRKANEARVEAEGQKLEMMVDELAKSERRLAEAQRVGRIGSWEYDCTTDTFTSSDELCRIYDHPIGDPWSADEVIGMAHGDDRDRLNERLLAALQHGHAFELDHRILLPDGTERIVQARGATEADGRGQIVMLRGTVQDVTGARDSESALRFANERLQQLATTDVLTGLPNRALFDDRLEQALALARREDRKVAVLYLDLDRFKEVNDSLGHQGGDLLLADVATRLAGNLRQSDTPARIGGDEFAVVLSGPNVARQAAMTAQRILGSLRGSFTANGVEFFAAASIGIALWPDDSHDKDELLRHADVAMYRAKKAGGNRFEMFRPSMTAAARDRLSLDAELRRAIDADEFFLRYHPQIDLVTGQVVAVEALLRWAHPTRGEVVPADFVLLAEETGLIVPLGRQVLIEACRQAARWRTTVGHRRRWRVAVNVAQRQLAEPGFAAMVGDVLRRSGVPPEELELEITESTLIAESGPAVTNLQRLRSLGVSLAIDDFGTGYSSLAYLRRFPVNRLKIDRSFVGGLNHPDGGEDSGDRALIGAAVSIAHALRLEAVAEGVETEPQRRILRACGCDQAQGFLWTEPLLPDAFTTWLADRTDHS